MNRTFKVVFNKARGALMVANEATCSVQKKGVKTAIAVAAALAMGSSMAQGWIDAPSKEEGAVVLVNQSVSSEVFEGESQFSYTLTEGKLSGFHSATGEISADKSVWVTATGGKDAKAHAYSVYGADKQLTNHGKIYIQAGKNEAGELLANSYSQKGMIAGKGATAINARDGLIVAKNAYGMTVETTGPASKVQNDGQIVVLEQGAGIELGGASGSTAVNNGTISVTGEMIKHDTLHFGHGVLINTSGNTFTNNGTISTAGATGEGADISAIEVKGDAKKTNVILGADSKVDGKIHFASGVTGSTLQINGAHDKLDIKSEVSDLKLDVVGGADIELADGNASTYGEVNVSDGKLTASIWQDDNKFSKVTVNEGGIFNITKLNSGDADGDNDTTLLLAFDSQYELNGGKLYVKGSEYHGDIKIGTSDKPTDGYPDGKGTATLTIKAGSYDWNSVSLGSAANNKLTITGGTLAVGELINAKASNVVLSGGTLQTASDQVYNLAEGEALIADSVGDVKVGESGASLNITATSGNLTLIDNGVYTTDSLEAMATALGEGVTLTLQNATWAQQNEDDVAKLVANTIQANQQVTETATNGQVAVANGSGAQSLKVAVAEEADPIEEVILTSTTETTLTLVGSSTQEDLVTDEDGNAIKVVVDKNLTLQLGQDREGVQSTAGKLEDLKVSQGAVVKVNNIEAQIGKLNLDGAGAQVTVGSGTTRGDLAVNELHIKNGATLFLDPAWSGEKELDVIGNASHLAVSTVGTLNGNLVVGQNSLAAIGTTSADAAVAAFNKIAAVNQELSLSWGEDNVTAALYVADTLTPGETGKVVVDGSLDSLTKFNDNSGRYTSQVYVAEYGMLMIDKAALGDKAAVNGTLTLEDGSFIGLVNADEGTIKLTQENQQVTITGTDGKVDVVTDNPFVDAELVLEEAGAGASVVAKYDGEYGLKALSSLGMQAMTRRADSVLASTIADRTSFGHNLKPGINLWVDVAGENYQADDFDKGGEFEADMGYGTFGGDVAIGNFTVGGALQYGTGSLRSSVSGIKNSIDNYGVSLYGTYSVTDAFKLGAELAYVWGENDITSNQTALNQSVDTEMYSVGLRAMYEMRAGNFRFVPSIGLRVSQLSTDEMKVGAVSIKDQDQTLVQVPIAMRISAADFATASGWTLSPSFKIAYVPTFGDKEIEALHMSEDVIDTSPVQADFGLMAGKDNMLFNVNLMLGAGEYGSSAVGGKVGFKYAF